MHCCLWNFDNVRNQISFMGLGCVCVCEGELGVGEWGVGIGGKLFR